MAHELKSLARQKVQYNNDNSTNLIVYQLVIDGVKVTPTSAKISVYRRGSSTALVSSQDMTVSGTFMTYAIDTTTVASWPIETGYRAVITVTYSADTYVRTVIFDVVRYILDLAIGIDQLADIDHNVTGMIHNDDDDLSGIIVAARTLMQVEIEAKVLKDQKMVENMILDQSHVAVAGCFLVLSLLYLEHGNLEKAEKHEKLYEKLIRAVLSTLRYDAAQDGDEDSPGGNQEVRLET